MLCGSRTEHVEHVNVRGLRYNPARGLNLMLGLRYVFGQPKPDPDPDPVVVEVMIQEAPEPGLKTPSCAFAPAGALIHRSKAKPVPGANLVGSQPLGHEPNANGPEIREYSRNQPNPAQWGSPGPRMRRTGVASLGVECEWARDLQKSIKSLITETESLTADFE